MVWSLSIADALWALLLQFPFFFPLSYNFYDSELVRITDDGMYLPARRVADLEMKNAVRFIAIS